MKKFVLAISMALVFASSVYAQTDGQYMGRTSQNFPIQFIVSGGGVCVDQLGYAVSEGCPSGGMTSWGVGYGGCQTIQPDGSFQWVVPPFDASGIVTYTVMGSFVAPDAAEGTIQFNSSQLQVTDTLGAQLCDSSIPSQVVWRAQRTMGPAESLKFDGSQTFTSVDQKTGNTSTSVKLK